MTDNIIIIMIIDIDIIFKILTLYYSAVLGGEGGIVN